MIPRGDPTRAQDFFAAKLAFTTGPVELQRMLEGEERNAVRVVDVRAEADFQRGHLPGSINLPRERWPLREGLEKEKVNVILCYSQTCHLAAEAALEFSTAGFSVIELEGGFKGWKAHRLPTEGTVPSEADPPDRGRKSPVAIALRAVGGEMRVQVHLALMNLRDRVTRLGRSIRAVGHPAQPRG